MVTGKWCEHIYTLLILLKQCFDLSLEGYRRTCYKLCNDQINTPINIQKKCKYITTIKWRHKYKKASHSYSSVDIHTCTYIHVTIKINHHKNIIIIILIT